MEKLIELLNEFLEENYPKKNLVKAIEDDYFVNNRNDNDGFLCETIMSKKFGFIKWLVENEKIDRDEIIINSDFMPVAFDRKGEKYNWSEEKQLLMLLSIQDEPIEFLISILK